MPHVTIDQSDGVAIVTVDRPPANALDRALLVELVELSASIRDGDAKAVVLTGREGFFSAGLDLKAVPAISADDLREMIMGDYRVGATTGKLGLTEVRVGVPYPAAAIAVVEAELEPAAARTLVLGGTLVEPPRALELGLVDELAAPNDLMTRALVVARELASSPADTYARIKEQLRGETVAAIDRVVRGRSDPLLESWLSSNVAEAASSALGRSS